MTVLIHEVSHSNVVQPVTNLCILMWNPYNSILLHSNKKYLEVELLVVRAISLNLVKGVIDEVDQKVHMTWVQPRVLNTEQVNTVDTGPRGVSQFYPSVGRFPRDHFFVQIGRMAERLASWVHEVSATEKLIEENARPILTC